MTDPSAPLVAFAPFERIVEGDEFGPRYVRRDLLLMVEKLVLPGMLHANHPHMQQLLAPDGVDGRRLVHCFAHAINAGLERQLWTDDQINDDTLFVGIDRYVRAITMQHLTLDEHRVTIVTWPKPVSPLEGFFAFLCRNPARPNADRYFISEMGRDAERPFLCSLLSNGHHNFGQLADCSLEVAIARVKALLQSSPPLDDDAIRPDRRGRGR